MQWIVQFLFCIIYYAKYIFVKNAKKYLDSSLLFFCLLSFCLSGADTSITIFNQLLFYPYAGSYLADRLL